jgi:hypothetical protein
MVQVIVRALTTVLAVVVGVAVSASSLGDSGGGKVVAAALIASIVALLEWLLIWAPKHSARARRMLDPRSLMVGVWSQDVFREGGRRLPDGTNRFAVYTVGYNASDGYKIEGRAYGADGTEHARWWSDGTVNFSQSGREMTYVFKGDVTDPSLGADSEASRSGPSKLSLPPDSDDSGTGHVEHVADNVSLDFDIFRVTPAWLHARGLDKYSPDQLRDLGVRNRFAVDLSRTLSPDKAE